MKVCSNKILTYSIIILLAYVYGIVTVKYKYYPYYELRELKQLIVGNVNASANANTNTNSKIRDSKIIEELDKREKIEIRYSDRKSFLKEHFREVDVIMLGDSLTDYAEWEDLFPNVNIGDYGIEGDSTLGVLDRIKQVNNSNASKVFVMIGVNDLIRGENVDVVFKNYSRIINELLNGEIKVYIQSTLLVGKNFNEVNDKVIELNNLLDDYASNNTQITYIDLNNMLSDGGYLLGKYSVDGLHLNGKGYKIWKEAIARYMM